MRAAVCTSLLTLGAGGFALGAASAPAAPLAKASASHSTNAPAARKRRIGCAKRSSFNSSSGYGGKPAQPHGKRRRASCPKTHKRVKRHAAKRHAASGACTDVQLRPSAADLALIDAATLCLVNRERTSRGLHSLRADADLQHAAQTHSAEMAAGDYFDHIAPSGSTPLSRMRAAGYIFSSHIGYAIGENIAWATLWLATPKAIVVSWMASPGHRANILDASFRETGVGVSPHPISALAHGQSGAIYTQDFGVLIRG
ncbi:MAG TPA: CAP domain-containing protein [Solirubrobacteraceae bacterium]|nr:CAP domain-containing protein [Solirubrobacteraceae bacterium]